MSKINLVDLQQFVTISIEGFGTRVRGIHMLTQSKVIDIFVKTIKTMLSAKIGDRIHVQHDLAELHSVVDKECLPMEYEDDLLEAVCSNEHKKYLAEMKASKTDETLRTADKLNEQIMGLPGSFRTLTVD
ncbi:putative CRAL/TRIO domain-containing protein [Operophtera brumata]|uniref:Putative CRAL/TRIO domain-containing protein n=1 Tax=Operophtera brumata TaxID=104452 RepID=A0A0L7L2U1_OPEBR|nr:putative CRAL/TRIO domain-containing protein [Operophtera brumata]